MVTKNLSLLLWAASLCISTSCNTSSQANNPVAISKDSLIKKGQYLVTIMGCNDCHSAKKMGTRGLEVDPAYQYGGHLANSPLPPTNESAGQDGWALMSMDQTTTIGPWGTSYSSNISSDATGIGNWTLEQFTKALREGRSKGLDGTRMLLPPMPWANYTQLADIDVAAIFEYLKNTKPINNAVPLPKPPAVKHK